MTVSPSLVRIQSYLSLTALWGAGRYFDVSFLWKKEIVLILLRAILEQSMVRKIVVGICTTNIYLFISKFVVICKIAYLESKVSVEQFERKKNILAIAILPVDL